MNTATGSSLEHTIGADGLLALRLRNGDVRINAVDGDAVRVRDVNGQDLEDVFAVDRAAGSLSLKAVGRGLEIVVGLRSVRHGRGDHHHDPDLEIDLPRRATLVLEAASSDVLADGLLGDQRYRTASGDVALRAVGGRIAIEAVSGDIEINATEDAQVSARSVTGDIELRATTLSALQLTTTSGDLKVDGRLDGPGPFAIETVSGDGLLTPTGDVRIEMTSVTGDLQSDIVGQQGNERGRRSLVIGKTGPLVTFRSMSGDLHVVRPSVLVERPTPPAAPNAPARRSAPVADPAPVNGAITAAYDDARLRILRSLERGEIDVVEAGRRLEQLDAGDAAAPIGEAPNPATGVQPSKTSDERSDG